MFLKVQVLSVFLLANIFRHFEGITFSRTYDMASSPSVPLLCLADLSHFTLCRFNLRQTRSQDFLNVSFALRLLHLSSKERNLLTYFNASTCTPLHPFTIQIFHKLQPIYLLKMVKYKFPANSLCLHCVIATDLQ